MKVIVVGSGNVATHLAKALKKAQVQIVQVWSHQFENASLLAQQVGATAIKSLSEADDTADYCLIAVKDDAIPNVVAQLKGFKGIIAHTAGAIDLSVFGDSFEHYGVFYPLQTFSKQKDVDFNTIPICLEANKQPTFVQLKQLAQKLSDNVQSIDSEQRKILHLAAVFACNFPNHLYNLAAEILKDHQMGFDLLRPLILETAIKVQSALPAQVQTGPAIRNDQQTMDAHLKLLQSQPTLSKIYHILSDSIKKAK